MLVKSNLLINSILLVNSFFLLSVTSSLLRYLKPHFFGLQSFILFCLHTKLLCRLIQLQFNIIRTSFVEIADSTDFVEQVLLSLATCDSTIPVGCALKTAKLTQSAAFSTNSSSVSNNFHPTLLGRQPLVSTTHGCSSMEKSFTTVSLVQNLSSIRHSAKKLCVDRNFFTYFSPTSNDENGFPKIDVLITGLLNAFNPNIMSRRKLDVLVFRILILVTKITHETGIKFSLSC